MVFCLTKTKYICNSSISSGFNAAGTEFDCFSKALYQSAPQAAFAAARYLGFVISKRPVFYCQIAQNTKYLATLSGRFIERLSKIPSLAGMKIVKFGHP